jgi:hypothetical protein
MPSAHPLAYCPTCKVAFPVAAGREGGTFVVRNSTTNCPNGHFARILNAHYQAFETEARATLATPGQGAHKAVWALWERLSRGETSPEQAQGEAERAKPGLGAIFNVTNFSDPTRRAILEVLFTDLVASPGPDEEPSLIQQDVTMGAPPVPDALRPVQEKRKGGNRAFQRMLRHKQRVLMNPRIR